MIDCPYCGKDYKKTGFLHRHKVKEHRDELIESLKRTLMTDDMDIINPYLEI